MCNNYYKQLIEESPTGYAYHRIICDKDGIPCDYEFIEVNNAFEALTGLIRSDIVSRKVTQVLPDIKKGEFDWISFYGDIAINGGKKEFEQFSEPLQRWYKVNVYSPKKNYFIAHFLDTSKERGQLTELDLERKRLANIIEGTNVGTWEWNIKIDETVVNERWAEIIGYTQMEISSVNRGTWLKCMHPEDLKKAKNQLNQVFAKEIDYYDSEFRLKHKEGSWVWVQGRGEIISYTTDGEPLLMSGTLTDITERKLAEIALLESEEKFRMLFNANKDSIAIFSLNPEGIPSNFIELNDAASQALGYTKEEFLSLSIKEIEVGVPEEIMKARIETLQTCGRINFETIIQDKEGNARNHDVKATLINYQNKPALMNISRDITNRKHLEEELLNSEAKLKAMISNISDVIAIMDQNGIIRYKSPNVERFFGWPPEDLVGSDYSITTHPGDQERVQKVFSSLLDKHYAERTVEYRYKVKIKAIK